MTPAPTSSHDRSVIREIAWLELFPALRLPSAVRMALNFKALALAAIALVGTAAGWRLAGEMFNNPDDHQLAQQIVMNNAWPWERPIESLGLNELGQWDYWRTRSPLVMGWNAISQPFRQLYRPDLGFTHFVYLLLCALWALLVWSFFGGAITRLAAVTIARHENQSLSQISRFVRPRWTGYFVAPLFPILGTFLAAAALGLLGLAMRTGLGMAIGGILWGGVLLTGFMMAFLLIGLFFGWPLMWGAVSAEGTDSFGALSHSYSYAYQRPLQYLLYAIGAAALGVLGWFLVSMFAVWIMDLSYWGVSWGSGAIKPGGVFDDTDLGTLGNFGKSAINFWNNGLVTLVWAFAFSYFWSSSTMIYFLLRRLVDSTEIDEVFMPEEQEMHGLPPLKSGPDGVAEVADEAAPV